MKKKYFATISVYLLMIDSLHPYKLFIALQDENGANRYTTKDTLARNILTISQDPIVGYQHKNTMYFGR